MVGKQTQSLGQTQQQQERCTPAQGHQPGTKGPTQRNSTGKGTRRKSWLSVSPSLGWVICGHECCLYLAWLLDNLGPHTMSPLSPHQARKVHPMNSYDHSKSWVRSPKPRRKETCYMYWIVRKRRTR